MSPADPRAEKIALLNDLARLRVPIPRGRYGRTVCTAGFADLPANEQASILEQIRTFSAFDEINDPYGERDFGALKRQSGDSVFWKIDYYADQSCTSGSEDPSDPEKTYRVLTIMRAEEY